MRNIKKISDKKNILLEHIYNNIKEYLIVSIIFLIGIVIGVIFVNKSNENQQNEINNYINNFITVVKKDSSIDKNALLKSSLKNNILLGVLLWFVGSTVVGAFLVYIVIGFRGFCLGYTIASIISVLGIQKGLLFTVTTVFLQNILFIPAILAIAVSGIKLYKSILKDKRKENIKIEIYRHTIFSILSIGVLSISSLIEVYVSSNLLIILSKYL